MRRYGYSRPALVVGFVLADGIETNLYQSVNFYGLDVFTRPIFLVLLALAGICVHYGMTRIKAQHQAANMAHMRLGPGETIFPGVTTRVAAFVFAFSRSLYFPTPS